MKKLQSGVIAGIVGGLVGLVIAKATGGAI